MKQSNLERVNRATVTRICGGMSAVAFVIGAALPNADAEEDSPDAHWESCGSADGFDVRLEPLSIQGAEVEVGVEFSTDGQLAPTIGAYKVVVVDDQGNAVPGAPAIPPAAQVPFGGVLPSSFHTPRHLRSGYYRVKVGLGVADDTGASDYGEGDLYLWVNDGETTLLSAEEWRIRSRYMAATVHMSGPPVNDPTSTKHANAETELEVE